MSLSKTLGPLLSMETQPDMTEKLLTGMQIIKSNKSQVFIVFSSAYILW